MKKYVFGSIPIAIFSQLLALGLHLYLTSLHYKLIQGTLGSSSVCSINEKLNCEAVSLSRYSEVLGIPLALWGFVINLAILILIFAFLMKRSDDLKSYRWATTLSLFSLLGSVTMGLISIFQMNAYCIFCILLYFLSAITFCCLYIQKINPKFLSLSDLKKLSALLILIVPIAAWLINEMETHEFDRAVKSAISSSIERWIQNPSFDFTGLQGLKMGSPNPKFVINEFADFQCIHCKHAAPTLEAFTLAHKNVELNYLPFPLDGKCNPLIKMERDGVSCTLAKAALCAEEQGKGWQVHKHNFDFFSNPESANLEKLSNDLNLDLSKLKSCIDSSEMDQKLKKIIEKAKEVNVEGTPTIFVNGKQLPNANVLPILQYLYDQINNQ